LNPYLDFRGNYDVPPVHSSKWRALTLPLLALIESRDRPILEIVAWGKAQGHTGSLVRHMLAWLSFNDLVYYVVPEKVWRVGAEPALTVDGSTARHAEPAVSGGAIWGSATQDDNLSLDVQRAIYIIG